MAGVGAILLGLGRSPGHQSARPYTVPSVTSLLGTSQAEAEYLDTLQASAYGLKQETPPPVAI